MSEIKLFAISGGPGTGKTSVINELSKKFKVLPEAAREVGENKRGFIGKSIKKIKQPDFQKAIFNFQKKELAELNKKSKNSEIVFTDRWFGDTLAYYNVHKLKVPKNEFNYAKKSRCAGVFIVDFLDFYEKDKLRQESPREQKRIHRLIIAMYKKLGYKPVIVPFMSIPKRAKFILGKIK